MMRFLLVLVLLAALSTAAVALPVVSPQAAVPQTAVGQVVAVDLAIAAAENLYGYQLEVEFDSTRLDFVQLLPGPFLSEGGKVNTFSIDPDLRKVGTIKNIAEMRTGPVPAVSGSGVLKTVQFRAKAEGQAVVRISVAKLSDSNAQAIPHTIGNPLTLTIGPEGSAVPAPPPPAVPPAQTSPPPQPAAPSAPSSQQQASAQQYAQPPLQNSPIADWQQPPQAGWESAVPEDGKPSLIAAEAPEEKGDSTQLLIWMLALAGVLAIAIGGWAFIRARKGDLARRVGTKLLHAYHVSEEHLEPAVGYLRQMRARGYADHEIWQQLRVAGWRDDKIQETFRRGR